MKIVSHYFDITDWFFQSIQSLLQKQKIVTIALPGGHSLDGWYTSVIWEGGRWDLIDKSCIRWCLVDERNVSPEDLDRNDSLVWNNFLKPLGVTEEKFLCFGASVDALEYSDIIGTPDIAFFGLWPDGHIASLFPNHPALSAQVEWYIHIHDAPKMPPERITLTAATIQDIRHTALFAVGKEKQEALKKFLNPEIYFTECPAKILTPDIIFQQ